ncbi:MAG: hypothetical protein EAZ53_03405 [Bacteroidetes bacterium]|nr:MAG: hypothetical protein EAZ53_03405 [Bacteroidota bacterium]
MKYTKYILIFCLLAASLFKCSCNEDPKPNPCLGKTSLTAEFNIYEIPFNPFINYGDGPEAPKNKWIYKDTDTTQKEHVKFVAKDTTADSYLWTIGAGVYTTTSVILDFSEATKNGAIKVDVSLKVTKKSDTTCFPTQKGVAESSRKFTAKSSIKFDESKIYGKYFGYRDGNPKDTATIIVHRMYTYPDCPIDKPPFWNCGSFSYRYFPISNIYNNCKSWFFDPNYIYFTKNQILLQETGTCDFYPDNFHLVLNYNNVTITCSIIKDFKNKPNERSTINFTGTKIEDL